MVRQAHSDLRKAHDTSEKKAKQLKAAVSEYQYAYQQEGFVSTMVYSKSSQRAVRDDEGAIGGEGDKETNEEDEPVDAGNDIAEDWRDYITVVTVSQGLQKRDIWTILQKHFLCDYTTCKYYLL